ncbi:MAG: hypothetical protein ACRC62_40005 [Microcoleus sp.]
MQLKIISCPVDRPSSGFVVSAEIRDFQATATDCRSDAPVRAIAQI